MNLEHQLQEALRPRDPGEDFTAAVMARVTGGAAAPAQHTRPEPPAQAGEPARRPRRPGLWPIALAASLLLVFVGAQQLVQVRQQERALAARAQLEQALAITSQELHRLQQRLGPAE